MHVAQIRSQKCIPCSDRDKEVNAHPEAFASEWPPATSETHTLQITNMLAQV